MKFVKLKLRSWKKLIAAYRKCKKENAAYRAEIIEYNKRFKK